MSPPTGGASHAGGGRDEPRPASLPADFPFERHEVIDGLGRTVEFYVSRVPEGTEAVPRPIVLVVQDVGCSSLFVLADGHQDASSPAVQPRIAGGLESVIEREFRGQVRVIAVEKPGVRLFENPQPAGSGMACREEFRASHSPNEWSKALSAALLTSLALAGVDAGRVLVVGLGEGAGVGAYLATMHPEVVTHLACLSGAGLTPLFDRVLTAQATSEGDGDASAQAAQRSQARVQQVWQTWQQIQDDPGSTTREAWGQPFKYWSSFMAISPAEMLLATGPNTRLFLAHGTRDTRVPIASFDAALATLASKQRGATVRRIPDADRLFELAGASQAQDAAPRGEGLRAMAREVVQWFLRPSPQTSSMQLLSPPSR